MNTTTSAITDLSTTDLAQAIAHGHLTAVEAVEAHLARIEAVNPGLNAIVVPLYDDARERARQADRTPAAQRGPLHGVPVTVKECFDIVGTPSTVGLTARAGHRADRDAPLVASLRAAGAIILGKTNVSQLLMNVESDNPVYGRTNNPRDPERSAGGSSGGEAAIVATGGSSFGVGTDIGGSVRVPAHACGIHALKPTPGQLSVAGTVEIVGGAASTAIPDTAGLLARHVVDLRLAFGVLASSRPAALPLRDLRVGVYEDDGFFPASAAIRRAVRDAAATLDRQGCRVAAFAPPDPSEALGIFYGLFGADGGDTWRAQLDGGAVDPRMNDLLMLVGMPDADRQAFVQQLRSQGQPTLARTVPTTGRVDAAGLAELLRRRDAYRQRFAEAMRAAEVDVLLCPPSAVPAFRHGTTRELGPASVSYTCLYNVLAYPAGVVSGAVVRADETASRPPSVEQMAEIARLIDHGSAGLPVGVQVVAGPGREDRLLTIMEAIEHA